MPPLIMAVDFHLLDELQGGYLLRRSSGGQVWNPAFDVTPAELIDGIVTEVGVVEKHQGAFDLVSIFAGHDGHNEPTKPSTIGNM